MGTFVLLQLVTVQQSSVHCRGGLEGGGGGEGRKERATARTRRIHFGIDIRALFTAKYNMNITGDQIFTTKKDK